MYSPKIAEDLIPILYQLARKEDKPLTRIVDNLLRPQVLDKYDLITETSERSEDNGRKRTD